MATSPADKDTYKPIAKPLTNYILRIGKTPTGDPATDQSTTNAIADRLTALIDIQVKLVTKPLSPDSDDSQKLNDLKKKIADFLQGEGISIALEPEVLCHTTDVVEKFADDSRHFLKTKAPSPALEVYLDFMRALYASALPDDVKILDDVVGLSDSQRNQVTIPLAGNNQTLNQLKADKHDKGNKITLPSVRTAKQLYPIAPRELKDFFREDTIYLLARDAVEASRVQTIRNIDVRDYMRHTLQTAYFAMTVPTQKAPGLLPPLADNEFMSELSEAIRERDFQRPSHEGSAKLHELHDALVERLVASRYNIKDRPIAALCWAIAVDAVLLDSHLRADARKVFLTHGHPAEVIENVHFYYPKEVPNEAGTAIFCDYVRKRWPIITFSLDPVTDQQNIADSFNLKRDLQLALSFSFATGQINFNQLDTFRRQIEQSSDTIALNRTVTGFTHGNENFGFRFTPRFQNPPNQRTNIGVIASQLISGGPGPDYQTRKSKRWSQDARTDRRAADSDVLAHNANEHRGQLVQAQRS